MGFAPRSSRSRIHIAAALPHHAHCTSRPDFGRACSIALPDYRGASCPKRPCEHLCFRLPPRRAEKQRGATPRLCFSSVPTSLRQLSVPGRGIEAWDWASLLAHEDMKSARHTRDPPAPHQFTCCTQQDLWGGGARSGRSPDEGGGGCMLSSIDFFVPNRSLTPTCRR